MGELCSDVFIPTLPGCTKKQAKEATIELEEYAQPFWQRKYDMAVGVWKKYVAV